MTLPGASTALGLLQLPTARWQVSLVVGLLRAPNGIVTRLTKSARKEEGSAS